MMGGVLGARYWSGHLWSPPTHNPDAPCPESVVVKDPPSPVTDCLCGETSEHHTTEWDRACDITDHTEDGGTCTQIDAGLHLQATTVLDMIQADIGRQKEQIHGDLRLQAIVISDEIQTEAARQKEQIHADIRTQAIVVKQEIRAEATVLKAELQTLNTDMAKQDRQDLRHRLADYYIQEHSDVPYAPAVPELGVKLHRVYVSPKLVHRDKPHQKGGERVGSYAGFFNNSGRVYLVGEPGTGKSTFSLNLVLLWSRFHLRTDTSDLELHHTGTDESDAFRDADFMENFDFLFYVTLRDACFYCDYVDMIRDQLLRYIYLDTEVEKACCLLKIVLNSATCLIIADGLDEWSHPSGGSCMCPGRERGKVPRIHQPHVATILTTSRPWRLVQIPSRGPHADRFIHIEGVDAVAALGRKVVHVINENTGRDLVYTQFEEYIHDKGVNELMTVPILLQQLVCLWADGHEVSRSLCAIYASIADMLISRCHPASTCPGAGATDMKILSLFSDKLNITYHWNKFSLIAKFAFEHLFPIKGDSSVVFNSNNCNLSGEVKQFGLKTGILTEQKSKSFSCRSASLSFLHKTVQEFLAAVYIASQDKALTLAYEPRYSTVKDGSFRRCITDMSQVFLFLCGIDIHLANTLAEIMGRHLSVGRNVNHLEATELTRLVVAGVQEADNSHVHEPHITLQHMTCCPSGNTSIYCRLLEMNQSQIVYLHIDGYVRDDNEKLTRLLHHLQYLQNLQRLYITDTDLGDHKLDLAHVNDHVRLDLFRVTVSQGVMLQDCQWLEQLRLQQMDLGDGPLALPSTVTHVILDRITTSQDVTLVNCSQLQHLTLNTVHLGDHRVLLPSSVSNIELWKVSLSVQALLGIVEHIERLPHDVRCHIFRCQVAPHAELHHMDARLQTMKCERVGWLQKDSTITGVLLSPGE